MNAKERLFAFIANKPVDKIPNLNLIMQFGAKYAGIPYSKYLNDFNCLADAELKTAQDFGLDALCVISDPYREAQGFGLHVNFPQDNLPISDHFLVKSYEDVKKLTLPDPYLSPRMKDRIDACQKLKSIAGSAYPIIGWVEGPAAEACDLRGVSEFMYDSMDEPEFISDLMDICLENAIAFAKAQIKAGADIIGVGDAVASLLGPSLYQEYVLPREQILFDAIHQAGALVKLHICGNITKLLPYIATTDADIVDVDHMVDFSLAIKTLKNNIACGNYDPVTVLLNGNADNVRMAVLNCFDQCNAKHAIISAGCEVPKNTPEENLYAAHTTLVEIGAIK